MATGETKPDATEFPDLLQSPLVYDKRAEQALVGWLLVEPTRASEVVSGGVEPAHFHGFLARAVFEAQAGIVARGGTPDLLEVNRELYASNRDVNPAQVAALIDGMPRGMNWEALAAKVREGAVRRKMARAFHGYMSRIAREPVDELRAECYDLLDQVNMAGRTASEDRWESVAAELIDRYSSGADDSISTGLSLVDRKFGGWPRGSFVIIGARTSAGKTSLATTLAMEHARAGRKVSFISREMKRHQIGHRYIGALTGQNAADIRNRRLDDAGAAEMMEALSEPLLICTDDTAKTWSQCRARIRQHARELGGVDVAFVDYIQLLDAEPRAGEKRYEAIGRISVSMKDLAHDMNCVVVACAQLNRGADERDEPRLSDLRESGNLEQDADIAWLIWRHPKDKAAFAGLVPVRLRVAKFRNGPVGEVTLQFRPGAMRFEEYSDEEGL